ncbi:transcriptional activator domain-containing protein [Gemmatirosa kalamazoonensis]|uniref:Transcriptional activator domain-containing protein n=1 Tax=Gemmatirosa kalamazoonensis TaxID=861299 RepID=W0RFG2_9BACT|nr:BTAD domain-containing putative transcriptional regulator [Gemmatirosa kalamazoonensis]AHG89075.1 transcriptional activator domain-containing protein [Gemmatirosa kalamazoonensis]
MPATLRRHLTATSTDLNTLSQQGFRLVTLGRLALLDPAGAEEPTLSRRRRKLALLAFLATAGRPVPRERLVEMFWGDADEERARHSLYDALSHFRRVLGRDAVTARQEEVALSTDAVLAVDCVELAQEARWGHHVAAARLYAGPFLAGVSVPGSVAFDRWRDGEEERLAALFVRSSSAACAELGRRGEWTECAAVARRWVDADPLDEAAVAALIRALDAGGTAAGRRAALVAYEQLAESLRASLDVDPGDEVQRLAAGVRERLATGTPAVLSDVEREAAPPVAAPPVAAPVWTTPPIGDTAEFALEPLGAIDGTDDAGGVDASGRSTPTPPLPPRGPARARRRLGQALTGMAIVALAGAAWNVGDSWAARRRAAASTDGGGAAAAARPVVALVVDAEGDAAADSSLRWAADALLRSVDDELSRATDLTVLPPERARGVWPSSDSTAETAAALGARLGATLVARGILRREPDGMVLALRVHDVGAGGRVSVSTVIVDSTSFGLADRTAARILAAAGARGPGLHFAELETASAEAYEHYVRAATLKAALQDGWVQELDRAIAIDSNFVSALFDRYLAAYLQTDPATAARLHDRMLRVLDRASERDRRMVLAFDAHMGARPAVSEAQFRAAVDAYPDDPRSYTLLARALSEHGKFDEAERVLRRVIAMAGAEPPGAPCLSCESYLQLRETQLAAGDAAGAAATAAELAARHPTMASAWESLADAYTRAGRADDALEAWRHTLAMKGDTVFARAMTVRTLLVARRFDDADTVVRALLAATPGRAEPYDVRALLERERGQFRASLRSVDEAVARAHGTIGVMELGAYARLHDAAGLARLQRRLTPPMPPALVMRPLVGPEARAWAWWLALDADARAESGDTVGLRAVADSLERVGRLSYYARDWGLHDHVRGLLAERAGRWDEAARDFERAMYGRAGWTRTNAELARAYLALGRPADALRVLRWACAAPLDAMGRYETRTELDLLMARAFAAAGTRDSARTYAGYVRAAWAHADPEIRARLAELPAEP